MPTGVRNLVMEPNANQRGDGGQARRSCHRGHRTRFPPPEDAKRVNGLRSEKWARWVSVMAGATVFASRGDGAQETAAAPAEARVFNCKRNSRQHAGKKHRELV